MDLGAIYNFGEYFSLQAKYSKGKNNSNNTVSNSNNTNTSAAIYKANVLSLDLSVRI